MQRNMRNSAPDRSYPTPTIQKIIGGDLPHCMEDYTPVMAYVPWQEWGRQFGEMEALMQGTLFPALVKPFCGGRN